MKKNLLKIVLITLILAIGAFSILPQIASAQTTGLFGPIIENIALSGIKSVAANISYIILTITSSLVYVAGTFLSLSMNISLHIKDLYDTATGIKAVWITVRDLSSMFIIFSLLYFSIMTILGKGGSSLGSLIINIFLAGVLINFSLFFVKVSVDASNLISLQFYNAIAPETSNNLTADKVFRDGGLSNVFVQSLGIQKIYNNAGILKSVDILGGISIATVSGIIIMVTAALSFLAAAIAFTARTGILLFVMALSPLFFAGMVFPEIKTKVSDRLFGLLKDQLIFMPVYLFLMYVALKIISDPNFMGIFGSNSLAVQGSGVSNSAIIGTIIQYMIAFIFINIPLVAAITLGGMGMKWAPGSSGANAINKWLGGKIGGFVGRNTAGRAARLAGQGFDSMAASAQGSALGRGASSILRTLKISQAVRGGLETAEKSKYGGAQSLSDIKEEDKKRTKFISGVSRGKIQAAAIQAVISRKGAPPRTEDVVKFREEVGKMNNKDFAEVDFDTLVDPVFAANLSSKQVDSLLEGDTLNPEQVDKFKKIRMAELARIFSTSADTGDVYMKKLSGKELSKLDKSVITSTNVMKYLTPSQLLEMRDLDGSTKAAIGDYIERVATVDHKAKGYMRKNRAEWS